MIDDARRDEAVDFVFGMLDPLATERFHAQLRQDAGLHAEVAGLEDAAAKLAYAAPLHRPPPELKQRIMAEIGGTSAQVTKRAGGALLPWAMAAGLAVAAIFLVSQAAGRARQIALLERERREADGERIAIRRRFEDIQAERAREVSGIRQELATLKQRDAMAGIKIATLKAQVAAYEKAIAVIVWDADAQHGLVKLFQFPSAASGNDYQLWVIDPARAAPVSAGVVPVAADGTAQVDFTPEQGVSAADAFAISIEPKGGSAAPQGEIVVLGK